MAIMIGLVGSVASGDDILSSRHADLNTLSNWQEVQTSQTFGITQVPGAVLDYFGAMFRTMYYASQNPMATGSWVLLNWIVLGVPLAIFVFGIVLLFFSIFKGSLS